MIPLQVYHPTPRCFNPSFGLSAIPTGEASIVLPWYASFNPSFGLSAIPTRVKPALSCRGMLVSIPHSGLAPFRLEQELSTFVVCMVSIPHSGLAPFPLQLSQFSPCTHVL